MGRSCAAPRRSALTRLWVQPSPTAAGTRPLPQLPSLTTHKADLLLLLRTPSLLAPAAVLSSPHNMGNMCCTCVGEHCVVVPPLVLPPVQRWFRRCHRRRTVPSACAKHIALPPAWSPCADQSSVEVIETFGKFSRIAYPGGAGLWVWVGLGLGLGCRCVCVGGDSRVGAALWRSVRPAADLHRLARRAPTSELMQSLLCTGSPSVPAACVCKQHHAHSHISQGSTPCGAASASAWRAG